MVLNNICPIGLLVYEIKKRTLLTNDNIEVIFLYHLCLLLDQSSEASAVYKFRATGNFN